MAVADSPYKYLGNVAPVQKLNVPKKASAPAGTKPYNPAAYVPGGSSAAVAGAIQNAGYANPGANPVFVPQPVKAPPSGGGGGGGGGTPGYWNIPDYDALLAGDWEPEQAAIQGQQKKADAEAAFQLAFRRAFVDWGGSADKLDEKFRKYLDNPTIEEAKNNKLSTMAQNLLASTRSINNQRAKLAARGMTRSGANTTLTRQALEAREKADYAAGREFTGGAETGLQGLASTEQSIADMIREAKSRAAARIAQENPQTWVPGTGGDPYGASEYDDFFSGPPPATTPPPAAVKPPAGTVLWAGKPMNAAQLSAELARTGVNRAQWISKHPGAAQTLGWA